MPRQNLTANACTVCRKKRTKCDGRHPCRRCLSRGEQCVYEDKMWRTKDHLRSEIERLRKEVQQCQGLIKALTIGGPEDEWKTIQTRLHRGEPPERIAAWISLSRSPAMQNVNQGSPRQMGQQEASPDTSQSSTSPRSKAQQATSGHYLAVSRADAAISPHSSTDSSFYDMSSIMVSPAMSGGSGRSARRTPSYSRVLDGHGSGVVPRSLQSWTVVTQDLVLLDQLLDHYLDDCFPVFSFICKEAFLKDLGQRTGLYCSSTLVNAILGLSAQSSNASSGGRADTCLSDRFLLEAKRLLEVEKDNLTIVSIQATGVLALAEASAGNDEESFHLATDCVRRTVLWKMKLGSDKVQARDPEHLEAMAMTFCGAFSLARMFRILTGRLDCQTGPLFMRLTPEHDDTDLDSPAARVERGVALQQHFFSQLNHCTDLLRFTSSITEIAHTFCSYHHDGGVTPSDLGPAYGKQLQAWGSFSAFVAKEDETTKEVLFAEIWYNYILMVLFSTHIESPIDLQDGITPKAVVLRASETIIFLAGLYQERFEFVAVHALMPHMVFAATLVQMRRPSRREDHVSPGRVGVLETADKRKKTSSVSPSPHATVGHAGLAQDGSPRRQGSPNNISGAEAGLVFPPWNYHVSRATMRWAGMMMGSKSQGNSPPFNDLEPPFKTASELAAVGTLHLTKMGITNRKAAELVKALRARSEPTTTAAAPPHPPQSPHALVSTASVTSQQQQSFPWTSTAGWRPADWCGAGSGFDAGLYGLGVDSLQGFAAMTGNPYAGGVELGGGSASGSEYVLSGQDAQGFIGAGLQDPRRSVFDGGLYIFSGDDLSQQMGQVHRGTVPALNEGFATLESMECVGLAEFEGGMVEGAGYVVDELG